MCIFIQTVMFTYLNICIYHITNLNNAMNIGEIIMPKAKTLSVTCT